MVAVAIAIVVAIEMCIRDRGIDVLVVDGGLPRTLDVVYEPGRVAAVLLVGDDLYAVDVYKRQPPRHLQAILVELELKVKV